MTTDDQFRRTMKNKIRRTLARHFPRRLDLAAERCLDLLADATLAMMHFDMQGRALTQPEEAAYVKTCSIRATLFEMLGIAVDPYRARAA